MKAKLHIPTEEYGFVEIEEEVSTVEHALEAYKMAKDARISLKQGLSPLEFNRALDGYLELRTMPSEIYEKMDDRQKGVMQELKKSFKRTNAKNNG